MLFSYYWLKELSGTKRSPEKLAELLMTHAFEVETVTQFEHGLEHVVIGQVLSVERHPNADRLRVVKVKVGKQDVREIVCGAPNVVKHQKVAVALPGAQLPGGVIIKESELRGVVSHGMICSVKELGLGVDHTGILVLPSDAPVGKDFPQYAGLDDVVLDVKILPDRSCDALSYRGLAHEIAALEGSEPAFSRPSLKVPYRLRKGGKAPKVTLKTERSGRYVALALPKFVTLSTPLAAQVRLLLSGQRPISPIVDLTNFVMLETGQPIHAFDAARIRNGGLVVREARQQEKLVLLDGTVLSLSRDDIVIADSRQALALAGVMGGKDSGIVPTSTSVVFEIAHFEAASIRRTEKRYRLQTDAAYRFERGIDVGRPGEVMKLLAERATQWGLGNDFWYREAGRKVPKPKKITLELDAVARLLGTKVPLFEAVQYCSWLGLSVKKLPNRQALSITIPLRRPDLNHPEDIIEEIGRMRGYATLPSTPLLLPGAPVPRDRMKQGERGIKDILTHLGFDEVMTYSFYHEKQAKLGARSLAEHLRLANPMNPDQALMRSSLFPNLLTVATMNVKHHNRFAIFEYGSVFWLQDGHPAQTKNLGLLTFETSTQSAETSFLTFKARLENLIGQLGVAVRFETLATHIPPYFHPTRVAHLVATSGQSLGYCGVIAPEHLARFGKQALGLYAELFSEPLQALASTERIFHGLSRFPLAERDISLIGARTLTYAQVEQVLKTAGVPLLQTSELFDVYEGTDEKSFAFHLGFGSGERTLTSDEVDATFERIVQAAADHLGMRLKSN